MSTMVRTTGPMPTISRSTTDIGRAARGKLNALIMVRPVKRALAPPVMHRDV